MRLGRRASVDGAPQEAEEAVASLDEKPTSAPTGGPWDVSALGSVEGYLDFGALLVPVADVELRLNIDEASGRVMSLAWLAEDAGLEVSVFAAPRSPGVWDELRPDLIADARGRGGSAEEETGPYGTDVFCSLPVQLPDGTSANQVTRIFAHQGDRWLLRGALMGRPVVEPEAAAAWYGLFGSIVVRRGTHAMPVGEALELRLPPQSSVDPAAAPGQLGGVQDINTGEENDG